MFRSATAADDSPARGPVSAHHFVSAPAIGKYQIVMGLVTVTRGSDVVAAPAVGDPVYQGDVIETGSDGLIAIVFVDGTNFHLSADARLVVDEFIFGAEKSSHSALLRVIGGVFGLIAGKMATTGRLIIDTPLAQIRSTSPGLGFGSLAVAVLAFALARESKADDASPAFLDDGHINYKDLPHGVFEIHTKGDPAHGIPPQVIIVDDPGVTVVITPRGSGVSVQEVVNSPTQMAQLQSAYQGALSTYLQGQQDPFIQHSEHAEVSPQSTGSTGSSTPPNELFQLATSQPIQVNTETPPGVNTTPVSDISPPPPPTIPFISPPPPPPSNAVIWTSPANANWDTSPDWNTSTVPSVQDPVEILLPVMVTVSDPQIVESLEIGPAATLDVVNGGVLGVLGTIDNAGLIQFMSSGNDTVLQVNGELQLTGGGTILMSETTYGNVIAGLPLSLGVAGTDATLDNVNNVIIGAGEIGVGNDDLSLINGSAGVIDATGLMAVYTGDNPVINAGVLEATAGGMLDIHSDLINSGTLLALSGSEVNIDANVQNTAQGLIEALGIGAVVNFAVDTISNDGTMIAEQGGTLGFSFATISNDGTVVDDQGSNLVINGPVTLDGSGTVTLDGSDADIVGTPGATFDNASTIAGTGQIGIGDENLTFVNEWRHGQRQCFRKSLTIDTCYSRHQYRYI